LRRSREAREDVSLVSEGTTMSHSENISTARFHGLKLERDVERIPAA